MGTSPSGSWFTQGSISRLALAGPRCSPYVASRGWGEKFGEFQCTVAACELNIALDLLRGAEAGRGGILLVEGEPGIGKSRILRELSDAAARHRFSLVCDAADKPLDQLPDDLSGPHAANWSAQPLLALSAGAGPGAGGRDGGDALKPGPGRRAGYPRAAAHHG